MASKIEDFIQLAEKLGISADKIESLKNGESRESLLLRQRIVNAGDSLEDIVADKHQLIEANFFPTSECLDEAEVHLLIHEELTDVRREHFNDCEFCQELVEGAKNIVNLKSLTEQIVAVASQKPVSPPSDSFPKVEIDSDEEEMDPAEETIVDLSEETVDDLPKDIIDSVESESIYRQNQREISPNGS